MITSASLEQAIVEVIKSKGAEGGFLSALGATPIGYDVKNLKSVTLGGSSTVFEGQNKPLTEHSETNLSTIKSKQTILLIASEESQMTRGGQTALEMLTSDAVSRIVTDVDLAITLGRSRDDGSVITEFAEHAIVPNASEILLPTPGDFSTFPAGLVTALSEAESMDSNILLSRKAFNTIAYATNSAGTFLYPQADKNGVFNLLGSDAKLSASFGFNATDGNGKNIQPNTNAALVGDFSTVYRSISNVSVRENQYGMVGSTNLFTENKRAYLIEVHYSFAVERPEDFTLVSSEVDAGE